MAETARDHARRVRPREVRAHTISTRYSKRHLQVLRAENAAAGDYERPKTRAECINVPRPCPYAGCKYHLYLDVSANGSLKLNYPDLEPHEMGESCVLDVAGRRPRNLEEVGAIMNITRERVRRVENAALAKLVEGAAKLREVCGGT